MHEHGRAAIKEIYEQRDLYQARLHYAYSVRDSYESLRDSILESISQKLSELEQLGQSKDRCLEIIADLEPRCKALEDRAERLIRTHGRPTVEYQRSSRIKSRLEKAKQLAAKLRALREQGIDV